MASILALLETPAGADNPPSHLVTITYIGVDSSNNVYVADVQNDRVLKSDHQWNYLTAWGCRGTDDGWQAAACDFGQISNLWRHLPFAHDTGAGTELGGFRKCTALLDHTFVGLQPGAKHRSFELDERNGQSGSQPHKFAESGSPPYDFREYNVPAETLTSRWLSFTRRWMKFCPL